MDYFHISVWTAETLRAYLLLSESVGRQIGNAQGFQDQSFQLLEHKEPDRKMIELTKDHGRFNTADIDTVILKIPESVILLDVNE